MPINFTQPTITGNYSTGVLQPINDGQKAIAQWLDPDYAGLVTSAPTGAKRLNSGLIEEYNGTAWAEKAVSYAKKANETFTGTTAVAALSASGAVTLAGSLAVTGAASFGATGRFAGATLGTIGVKFGSGSGATPVTDFDKIVIDLGAQGGMSILSPNNVNSYIVFGDPENSSVGGLRYAHGSDTLSLRAGNVYVMQLDATGVGVSGSLNSTGDISGPRLRLTSPSGASLASTTHGFQLGVDAGLNLTASVNEVLARNNGATSTLTLNGDGGLVLAGIGGLGTRGRLFSHYNPVSFTPQGVVGDVIAARGADSGVYFFGESTTAYLTWNGTNYVFGSAGAVSLSSAALVGGQPAGYRTAPRITSGAIDTALIGCVREVTANITIPANVFAGDDIFSVYNASSAAITLVQGSGLTLRLAGTATTGSRVLSQRAMATLWCRSATEIIASGVS